MVLCLWKRVFGSICCGLAILAIPPSHAADSPSAATGSIESGLITAQASADARYLGQWIDQRADSGELPFAIVDKKHARLYVFDDTRTLVGSSVVLTGAMPGDESVPGVGQRAQSMRLAQYERTTPAGRFGSQPGHNLKGEDIVWFDYGAALAIHRLRPGASHASRSGRLASATPDDNRASLGCVVVPVEFYERVVRPWLGVRRGLVYVLPDNGPVQAWWPGATQQVAGIAEDS